MFTRRRNASSRTELKPATALTKTKFKDKIKRPFKDKDKNKDGTATTDEGCPDDLTSSNVPTSASITSYVNQSFTEHTQSSHMQTSLIMSSNITRLKKANRFLTPIVDEIISKATSYTHKQFKAILTSRQPICSISYSQYIKAYQASELISQVSNELSSVDFDNPYQVNFTINNVDTIKKEDLLQNIERMADRIFIDRDLMKQLVNLHELITDTIDKLKDNLKQVSVEGITPAPAYKIDNKTAQEDTPMQLLQFDRDTVRKNIAEHFIIIGEPKNKGCYCRTDATNSRENAYNINTKSTVMPLRVRDSQQYTREKQQKAVKASRKSRKEDGSVYVTKKESKCSWRCSPCTSKYKKRKSKLDSLEEQIEQKIVRPLGDESPVKEVENEPTCTEDTTKACAVLPEDLMEEEIKGDDQHPHFDVDDASLIVAESDSFTHAEDDDSNDIEGKARSGSYSDRKPVATRKPSPMPRSHGICTEDCGDSGVQCSEITEALRNMMTTIADQLMILKENDIIDFEEKEFEESEIDGVDKEFYTMQEVMYCLESIEKVHWKLIDMNFMEVSAEHPKEGDCCYRIYPHVHAEVVGIPIIVKISQAVLDLLCTAKPTKTIKHCACKPPTLKNLLKEKCALAKMIQLRRDENKESNKVVMMTVHPMHDGVFGMRADSLLVESAFEERKPDVFQVMDLADSNTSLPYVVNRTSLPNITICRSLEIDVAILRQQVISYNVEHPKPRIEHELQNIGLDNLLRASVPAECCMPYALNRNDADHEPFHASLNSLPLTTSDLQIISDVVEEKTLKESCNYTPIHYYYLTATVQFTFERYTNFQEEVIFMPPMCRVYLVYYFEIFKRDVEEVMNPKRFGDQKVKRTCSKVTNRRRSKQDGGTRATRQMVTKFFRRIIFALPPEEQHEYKHSQSDSKTPKKKSKNRKSDGEKSTVTRQISSKKLRTKRRLKNQRLQASATELDNYQRVHQALAEADLMSSNSQCLDVFNYPSALNTFTVSTMTATTKNMPKMKDTRSISARNRSTEKIKIIQSSKVKKTFAVDTCTSKSEIDFQLNSKEELEITGQQRRELKGDLGTIYECEEKLLPKEGNENRTPPTLLEILNDKDLSSSEQAIDIFQRSNLEPEQFWSIYFKQRREARLPPKTISTTSISLLDTTHSECQPPVVVQEPEHEPEPKPTKSPSIPKVSRIPRLLKSRTSKLSTNKPTVKNAPIHPPETNSKEETSIICPEVSPASLEKILFDPTEELKSINDNTTKPKDKIVPEAQSMNSLLSPQNGPGYMTILHPACGCPEVSIFVPCYCGGKGPKHAGLTAKHVARLSANTNGRHIMLPTSCRIPRLKCAGLKGKPSQVKNRKKPQDTKYSKCYIQV